MSHDEAPGLLADLWLAYWNREVPVEDFWAFADIQHVVEGTAPTVEEERETVEELERIVAAGKAPDEVVQAFRILAAHNRRVHDQQQAEIQQQIAVHGVRKVGTALEAERRMTPAVFDAFMDAADEYEARHVAPTGTATDALTVARPRESRPRGSRGSRRTSNSSNDDDGLADLPRRCPRCGGAARPKLPSALWTCDTCSEAIWEQLVQHELQRVLAEADRIVRGAE